MTTSLWSKAFGRGLGLLPAARVCSCSQRALALHAIRAGRLSFARSLSAAAPAVKGQDAPSPQPSPPKPNEKARDKREDDTPNATQPKFETLEGAISPRTLKALIGEPFKLKHMSPVQAAVLPLLPGLVDPHNPDEEQKTPRDLMVKARTGTGKTLAFLIPAVESRLKALRAHAEQVAKDNMSNNSPLLRRAIEKYARTNIGALIISPTRELATQIANEAIKLTEHHEKFEVRLFVGGLPKRKQLREWNLGRRDIVVATPGRLRDFIENEPGFVEDLGTTEMFILDEADTLLEMGFREDIYAITEHLKQSPERQTFMFSATMSTSIQQVARKALSKNYTFLNCVPDDAPPTHMQIPQFYTGVPSPEEQIPHILRLIAEDQLQNPGKSKVLIFLPTTRMVKLYSTIISQLGPDILPAGRRTRFAEMHSKKNMQSRINTSDWFRKDASGATVMLTSDVSARGVDYPNITRVIQIGVPPSADGYVHRVGRTGRGANMGGRADIVLLPWELGFLTWRLTDIPIQELTTNQLKSQVTELAEKYEQDPKSFFPSDNKERGNRRFQFQSNVLARLGDIEGNMKELQNSMDQEEVTEAIGSMLAFYASNSGELRVDREVTVAGVHAWAEALLGEKVRLRIPREFLDMKYRRRVQSPNQNRPRNRWEGRGKISKPHRNERADREFNWDNDISGSRSDRRGESRDREWDRNSREDRPRRYDDGEKRYGSRNDRRDRDADSRGSSRFSRSSSTFGSRRNRDEDRGDTW